MFITLRQAQSATTIICNPTTLIYVFPQGKMMVELVGWAEQVLKVLCSPKGVIPKTSLKMQNGASSIALTHSLAHSQE